MSQKNTGVTGSGRKLLVIIGLLLAAGLVAFLVFRGEEPPAAEPVVEAKPRKADLTTDADFWERLQEPGAVDEDVELNLKLLGTSVASDARLSRAAIRDLNNNSRQVLGIGDQLKPYEKTTLTEVYSGRAVIDHDGERIVLELDKEAPQETHEDRRLTYVQQVMKFADEGKVHEGLAALVWMHRGERDQIALESHANWAPYYDPPKTYRPIYPHGADKDRPMIGAIVSGIAPGSFYDEMGLKEGDIVKQINDVRFDQMDAFNGAYESLRDDSSFRVSLIRDGEPLTLEVETMPPREQGVERDFTEEEIRGQ
jgi:type II secretory pathway component PulC